jgi:hypothetical protein
MRTTCAATLTVLELNTVITLRITAFLTLSIAQYSKNQRAERFGDWICFLPQNSLEPTCTTGMEPVYTLPLGN